MLKYFRYLLAIVTAHIWRKNIPVLVTLGVTHRCNMRCIYCYGEFYDRRDEDLSTDRILSLIDELAVMGTRFISLNGGEALLRPDIGRIVDAVRSKGMLCHLSSNGILVAERLDILRKIDSLAISIDGIGADNDLTRGQGTIRKVLRSLELLKKEKIPFHTHTVITRHNRHSFVQVLDLAEKLGAKAQFSLCRATTGVPVGTGLSDIELRDVGRELLALKKARRAVFFSSQAYFLFLAWPFSYSVDRMKEGACADLKQYPPCYIKRFSCHIEPDGSVYPCIVRSGKGQQRNIRLQPFAGIWKDLEADTCRACYNVCCNDLNLIFALDRRSVSNAVSLVLGRLKVPRA